MRKPLVAGNWKMNKTISEARQLTIDLIHELREIESVEVVLCPPFTALTAVEESISKTNIKLGAQNIYWKNSGAFTGEISPVMVAELCRYVIIGHSERRAYFGENDETVNWKMKSALEHNLIPIMCVGETLDENEAGRTDEVVSRQVKNGLVGIVNGDNAGEFFAVENIDGALVGGASLKAMEFAKIVQAAVS